MPIDWSAIINAAHEATDKHGVPVQRGKKYLEVAKRVELLRLHFGAYGIETDLVHFGPEKGASIVVRAVIRDLEGRTVATGIAEEIRGKGNVNTTSAVENAETSAIGRALAALGLHGGEFASLNEVERATNPDVRKNAEEAQEQDQPPPPAPDWPGLRDSLVEAVLNQPASALVKVLNNRRFHGDFDALMRGDRPKGLEVRKAVLDAWNKAHGGQGGPEHPFVDRLADAPTREPA